VTVSSRHGAQDQASSREAGLGEREAGLDDREAGLDRRELELDRREARLAGWARELGASAAARHQPAYQDAEPEPAPAASRARLRARSEAATRRAEALRKQVAEAAARLAATEEEIARAQDALMSRRPRYSREHEVTATAARKAARRAREIEDHFTAPGRTD
jgi:hypothetical protein